MKAVILQPSYIPWRGYFDQIRRSDVFIFYDDVQYDKDGWRNRNRIKTSQGMQWLTIPVHSRGVTGGVPICEIEIDNSRPWARKHLTALSVAYGRAPYFKQFLPLLNDFYARTDARLADFVIALTMSLSGELGIHGTRFMRSSEITGVTGRKTDRLIEILSRVGADHYISGPSAQGYIEAEKFEAAGIALEYMSYDYPEYPQLHGAFEPHVTILDLLFMTGAEASQYLTRMQP